MSSNKSPKSPKGRLSKLFHRHAQQKDEAPNTPPPASPISPSGVEHVRKSASSSSFRDAMHSKSRDSPNARATSGAYDTAPSAAAQIAAARALKDEQYAPRGPRDMNDAPQMPIRGPREMPNVDHTLPSVPHEPDLSSDLQRLIISDPRDEGPYSERIADRNMSATQRSPPVPQHQLRSAQQHLRRVSADVSAAGSSRAQPLDPRQDPHSEGVADYNIAGHDSARVGGLTDLPHPLKYKKRSIEGERPSDGGASPAAASSPPTVPKVPARHSVDNSSPDDSILARNRPVSSSGQPRHSIKRSSLEKPLPSTPAGASTAGSTRGHADKHDSGVDSTLGRERGYLVKDAKAPVDLSGIVNLNNTEDTTLHERWAPAVTHETIRRDVHYIREEQITREIHNHHIFHRILPIVDIEVLPARHFVPVEGGYAEISEDEVPGRAGPNAQWLIAETVSKLLPKSTSTAPPRQFSARKFERNEGQYKEYMAPEGFKRTEQWWVHPPTIEDGGRRTGQTYPFVIGSPNPAENGLRAALPAGQLVGVSPLLAKQQRERLGTQQQQSASEQLSSVPQHKSLPQRARELADARSDNESPRFI